MWPKGIVMFLFALLVFFFTVGTFVFFPITVAVIDGFLCAKKINKGVPKEELWTLINF